MKFNKNAPVVRERSYPREDLELLEPVKGTRGKQVRVRHLYECTGCASGWFLPVDVGDLEPLTPMAEELLKARRR